MFSFFYAFVFFIQQENYFLHALFIDFGTQIPLRNQKLILECYKQTFSMGCVSIHTLDANGSKGCTRSGKDQEKNSLSLQLHLDHEGGNPINDCASGHKVISGLGPGRLWLLCGLADCRVLCVPLWHWSLLEAESRIPNLLRCSKSCIFYDWLLIIHFEKNSRVMRFISSCLLGKQLCSPFEWVRHEPSSLQQSGVANKPATITSFPCQAASLLVPMPASCYLISTAWAVCV